MGIFFSAAHPITSAYTGRVDGPSRGPADALTATFIPEPERPVSADSNAVLPSTL